MNTLPRARPSEMGIDAKCLLSFVERLGEKGCRSVIVLRHKSVVAEGWWKPYQLQSHHMLYSLRKSFISTAVGFAVQQGRVSTKDVVMPKGKR